MRFRPANIRLINRRSNLPRLLLALSSKNNKSNDKNNTTDVQRLTGSLHIRAKPELVYPFELDARPPLPVGRVDLSAEVSRHSYSGFAINST
ncbi:MAG: hypothetical protein WBM14_06220, partial [Terracidiphilus sp.]